MTNTHESLVRSDLAHSIHPYTNLSIHEERGPLIITRGEGIYVWDDQGNRYIEGLSGLWCTGLGYSEKRLMDAAQRQFEMLPFGHSFAHRASAPTIELAEKLIASAPDKLTRAYFVNSGSEAVDTAVKFAWYYNNAKGRPEKKKIISRKFAYHGVTVAAGSLTGLPFVQDGFDLPIDRVLHTETPHYYRGGLPGESEEAFASRLADELEQLILNEGPDTVAAFIAEPIMGSGGVLIPPATYFEKVQQVLQRHEVLLIADEVICGFGRTGQMWGSQTFGIEPDLITCAKQLSSAYVPIGAVLASEEIYQAFVSQSAKLGVFGQGNTYGGHPVSAAVALETMKIYEDDNILGHVNEVSPRFLEHLEQLQEHPLVGNARGIGLIGAIELVADKESNTAFAPERKAAALVNDIATSNGLILRALPGDCVGLCPPLIITQTELDDIFDRLNVALNTAHSILNG